MFVGIHLYFTSEDNHWLIPWLREWVFKKVSITPPTQMPIGCFMTCPCFSLSIGDDLSLSCTSSSLKALAEQFYLLFEMQILKKMLDRLSDASLMPKQSFHCKYQQSQPISTLLVSPQVRIPA